MSSTDKELDEQIKLVNKSIEMAMKTRALLQARKAKSEADQRREELETRMTAERANFQGGADDLVEDPRYAVPVSRHGADVPARKRDTERVIITDKGGDKIEAQRVRSGITRLFKDGLISDRHVAASLHFQWHFTVLGYDEIATVDLQSVARGQGGIEHHLDRKAQSRKIVEGYYQALGGEMSVQGQIAYWIIGLGSSVDEYIRQETVDGAYKNKTRHFWMGVLVSVLETMTTHHEGMNAPRRHTIRADDDCHPPLPLSGHAGYVVENKQKKRS